MDKVITRAIETINKLLESLAEWALSRAEPELIKTRKLLDRLLQGNSPKPDWVRLFCRQLNRLMDYNDTLPIDFWTELHDAIQYVLEEPNEKQEKVSWKRFCRTMKLEFALEQRELQFHQRFGERKSLRMLLDEHKQYLEQYFKKCVSLHSKVQAHILIENIDNFLCKVYGLTKVSLTPESRKRLKENLNCIKITLDCSDRSLHPIDSRRFVDDTSRQRATNNDPTNFLPTDKQIEEDMNEKSVKIEKVLRDNRWIIILGEPDSAKTTILQWITRIFAEAALSGLEEVKVEKDGRIPTSIPFRVPILIQMDKFATWYDEHQTMTLMDYIGEHTWFSEPYCHDRSGSVLKEFIYHGHALILLDGLDEISEVGRRGEIVGLVRKFVDEYVHSSDFISAFDEMMFSFRKSLGYDEVIETQLPSKSGGNQIVVTSRIVGYEFYPLLGPFIQHHLLSLMCHEEADEFVKKCIIQVEKRILDAMLIEQIKLDEKTVESLSKRRYDAVEAMFRSTSKLLMSNPSLLSVICSFIFQSTNEFSPKTRVQVYNQAVQVLLHYWNSQEASISETMLLNFLIDLAFYLHLQSPSGLIDKFDIERLCQLVLQRQGVSNDRIKLREYASKLISLLQSNSGIVGERKLDVFGFRHLSFREYFVAQSFVRSSAIQEVAKYILLFTINSRFRESLLLALGWISLKWPFSKYDKLCNLLVAPTTDYVVPLATLLFFDAINDLQRLPSNTVIFTALNNLLDHSSHSIRNTYLISNLSKLPEDTIKEWMQTYLKDNDHLLRFCQSFPVRRPNNRLTIRTNTKLISSVVYQQLWLLRDKNTSIEFIIDQTLQRTIISNGVNDQIFNQALSFYFLSNDICVNSIHPLIGTVLIAVCGGICLTDEKRIFKIHFSPKLMHRESIISFSIMEYFDNKEESHSIKVQTLIKQYENVLEKSSPLSNSVDIVDTFIALICLQGVSQPYIYQKYDGYQALPLALDRLKRTWFYFKESRDFSQSGSDTSLLKSEVESIMNVFFSQNGQSNEQCMSFSLVCEAAWKKLGLWNISHKLTSRISRNTKIGRYCQYQPDFIHLIGEKELDEITQNTHSLQMLKQKPALLVTILPQSFQQVYYRTTISPTNDKDSLPFVVFLSQCLTYLDGVHKNDVNSCVALLILYPLLKNHQLENYALALFQEKYSEKESPDKDYKAFMKAIRDRHLLDPYLMEQPNDWKILIDVERQHIRQLKNTMENQEKYLRLFAAAISLARLSQAGCRFRGYDLISLPTVDGKEVYSAIRDIHDSALRIVILSIILDMKNPLVFDEEQRDELRWEMVSLMQSLFPDVPLLKSTLLFIRCQTAHQFFPMHFHHISNIIGKKLNETPGDKPDLDQEVAYIALRQLNNPDLLYYLSEFVKRTKNLSDLVQLNSTILHQYFTNTISFDSSNTVLLSSMYLAELAFDTQILKIYIRSHDKNNTSSLKELKELLNESSKYENIMTFKVATWITIFLQMSTKEELREIIQCVSRCKMIERKALTVIVKWLDYRMDKVLNFFAHYAALQLVIEGSNIFGLASIINEKFIIDKEYRLTSLVERLFTSQFVDLSILRLVVSALHRNVDYSSCISVSIDREEILEMILSLELERVTSNMHDLFKASTKPFLFMIKDCSIGLKLYLVDYLRVFIDTQNEIEIRDKEEYVAVIVNWIIRCLIESTVRKQFSRKLYEYIFVLLYDQRFPRVQKVIINTLNAVFIDEYIENENLFILDNIILNLEKMICSWKTYTEDVIAAGLLVYITSTNKLNKYGMIRNVSEKMKNTVIYLSKSLSSETISIRAGLCLDLLENSKYFFDIPMVTPERRYRILLQRSSCKLEKLSLVQYKNENEDLTIIESDYQYKNIDDLIDLIDTHSDELMDIFVTDLYSYLCDKDNNSYLFEPALNYVQVAVKLSQTKSNELCSSVRKSSFGEEELKTKLSFYCENHQSDNEASIELYVIFGMLTIELLNMLECVNDSDFQHILHRLKERRHMIDRDTIEKLFDLLNLTKSKDKFQTYLFVLRFLVQSNVLSSLEVHQRLSLIKFASLDSDDRWWSSENDMFDILLDLSCIEKLSWNDKKILFTGSSIEEEFARERN